MAPIKCGYYLPSAENVDISPLPPQYFTHMIYAFLNPDFHINDVQKLQTFTATLHAMSPPVKALFSVGGGIDKTAAPLLSLIASEPSSRAQFIKSSISVARRFKFDGVDLVWKYPQNPAEMENLGTLLEEWRQAVTDNANSTGQPPLLLTAAVYYLTTITWPTYTRSYPVSTMSTNLDFINVMAFDYHGSWEPNATGALAALYDPIANVSTDAGIESWTGAGMPPEKLVMGLPLYGRTWRLVNPATSSGIGAPANGVGPGTDGVMTYAEVVQFNQDNNARVVYDHPGTESVYSVAGSDWISYDDPRSVRAKVHYAKARGLGGHFFWQVAGDYKWTLSKAASESWLQYKEDIFPFETMAPIKGGYYPSWAQNLDIPTQFFTHIIYAFLNPEDGTFQFNIDDDQAALLQTFTATLHAKSPPVKVLFAVGGGTDTAAPLLSRMASGPTSRAAFITSSIDVARTLGFDGIDLDWEYPQDPTEMENFGDLLQEWRLAVTEEANSTGQPPLLLTAAVYYLTTITWPTYTRSYPVSIMSTNLDFINVMAYDYHGSWEPNATGALAALYDPIANVSTDAGIDSWTGAGMPPEKLVMGLPLYGRTWTLVDPATSSGIGAPANGVGPGVDGAMTYAEVVQFNEDNNARVVYDEATVSVYSVAGSDWISYDDPRSVRVKAEYGRGRGLGGYFFWQVAGDYQWTLSQTASESW